VEKIKGEKEKGWREGALIGRSVDKNSRDSPFKGMGAYKNRVPIRKSLVKKIATLHDQERKKCPRLKDAQREKACFNWNTPGHSGGVKLDAMRGRLSPPKSKSLKEVEAGTKERRLSLR